MFIYPIKNEIKRSWFT